MNGIEMHDFAKELWPINRSLTGKGVRLTLNKISKLIPQLTIKSVNSGTEVFDWVIPKEWDVEEAYIISPNGDRICDFQKNNLHLVGYSTPANETLNLSELQSHLYSLPEQPNAIPYITSYYKERWGFCLSQNERDNLVEGDYKVVIKSKLFDGVLNYGELLIKGHSEKEVFISTYICHPSMANNELSGPVVVTSLIQWLMKNNNLKYSYRIVFIPETIGSITYLSQNLDHLKNNVIAGFNVSCIGDDRCYSYLPSRNGNTLSDRAALKALHNIDPNFKSYSWLDRGSDERQYCAPGIDLPIATIMRSKYGEYPEYHTSLDNLEDVVTPTGLEGGLNALQEAIKIIELNTYLKINVFCEPQLGKRGLYPNLSTKGTGQQVRAMMNLITYCDGKNDLLAISELINEDYYELSEIIKPLIDNGLISILDDQIIE